MGAVGKYWRDDLVSAVDPCSLVLALGPGWVSCSDALPWADRWSSLRYVVYSPRYCGDLLLCRFQLLGATRWWHEGMEVGISGVTHWRIAQHDEGDSDYPVADLPVTTVCGEPLEQLKRWWAWFKAYKGLSDDC